MFENFIFRRVIGCILAFIGVVLLICFMPFWMWLAILGIVLIIAGCVILVRGFH